MITKSKNEPINPEDLIRTGIITFFNEAKGYGFIKDSVSILTNNKVLPTYMRVDFDSETEFNTARGL